MLVFNKNKTIAWQKDRSISIKYDKEYHNKLKAYEYSDIEIAITNARIDLTMQFIKQDERVLDYGCGTGIFIKKHPYATIEGYDVMYSKNELPVVSEYNGVTFWDSLEHLPEPNKIINAVKLGSYVFISIPIFKDLDKIKDSKHYRPNEHYWYFTDKGLKQWMYDNGYTLETENDNEIKAGRENIMTYVFARHSFHIKRIILT